LPSVMASALTGNAGPRATGRRQSSLSSFPNTGMRPPSRNGRSGTRSGRSPKPPSVREHSQSASISSNSTGATTGVRRAGETTAVPTSQPADHTPVTRINTSDALRPTPGSVMGTTTGRKLRSQYPTNGYENHVEYILVASFDIDRGSVMEHQYPAPISGDET